MRITHMFFFFEHTRKRNIKRSRITFDKKNFNFNYNLKYLNSFKYLNKIFK